MPRGIYKRTKKNLENMSKCRIGKPSNNKGKIYYKKIRKKMSEAQKKAWSEGKYTEKRNKKIRKSMSKLYAEGKLKIGGLKLSEHPNWKGGITSYKKGLWSLKKYQDWRIQVFKRDDFTCQNPDCEFCNNKLGGKLQAHHLVQVKDCISLDNEELIFDVDNGITYCKDFHLNSELHKK